MLKRVKGFTLIELLIVVAIIAILAAIAVPNFLEAQTRAKVSRVRSDLRTMATAVESYYIDANAYPAVSSSVRNQYTGGGGAYGLNDGTSAANGAFVLNMPTFRRKQNDNDRLMTLTTPVAYITSFFSDPFADTKSATFNYSKPNSFGVVGWIMWSYGPDADEKTPTGPPATPNVFGGDIPCIMGTPPFVETTYYDPSVSNPTVSLLANGTYDPTNGTTSNGDVYRTKQ